VAGGQEIKSGVCSALLCSTLLYFDPSTCEEEEEEEEEEQEEQEEQEEAAVESSFPVHLSVHNFCTLLTINNAIDPYLLLLLLPDYSGQLLDVVGACCIQKENSHRYRNFIGRGR
jgi:hypothetical protein